MSPGLCICTDPGVENNSIRAARKLPIELIGERLEEDRDGLLVI